MRKTTLLASLLLSGSMLFAQTEKEKGLAAITDEAVRGQLEFLASDWTEGRAVGTKGAYIAADYIASMFKTFGVQPFGDAAYTKVSRADMYAGKRPERYRTYFQNFSLIQYKPGEEQSFSLITDKGGAQSTMDLGFKTDYYVNSGSVGQSCTAPLVFAGYGLSKPKEGYDDLKKLDLEGKIAVIVSGFPGHKDKESEGYEKFAPKDPRARYYFERDKISKLKEAGVVGIIKIDPNYDPTMSWAAQDVMKEYSGKNEAGKFSNPYYSTRMMMPGKEMSASLPSFTLTPRAANAILADTGVDMEAFENLASTKMTSSSKELTGHSVAFKTTVESKVVKARNVLGYIEGENKDEFIVVGGHYDHLGMFDGVIYNGADDNASGTVGVMTIAKAFMATGKKPKKSIIFAAWTGEEKGLFGSRYFVQDAMEEDMNIVLNLNYDMIARNPKNDSIGNMAHMNYTKANHLIASTTKGNLEKYDIDLDLDMRGQERPGGGSDHAPFAQKDIPIFYFMAAMHPDYHQPGDELSKINWEKMTNIIRLGFLDIYDFSNSDDWKEPMVADK